MSFLRCYSVKFHVTLHLDGSKYYKLQAVVLNGLPRIIGVEEHLVQLRDEPAEEGARASAGGPAL